MSEAERRMDNPTAERMQQACDRSEIIDCLHRYARGMDRLDRDLVLSAYHADAIDDHGSIIAPAEEFVDWAFRYHAGQVRHQHYVSNHSIELDGDTSHVETYFTFVGTDRQPPAPLLVYGGRYVDRFERRDGRWAIAARLCLVEWQTEAPSLRTPEAMGAHAAVGVITRDRTDASYQRPLATRPVAEA